MMPSVMQSCLLCLFGQIWPSLWILDVLTVSVASVHGQWLEVKEEEQSTDWSGFSACDLVVSNWQTELRKRGSFEKEGNCWVLCGACWVLDSSKVSWLWCPVENRKYTHHSPNKLSHYGCLQPSGLVLLLQSGFATWVHVSGLFEIWDWPSAQSPWC